MAIHSADDYEPNLSVPVFGSGVSQTKLQQQQQPNNDLGGAEKLDTPELTKNGQNDTVSDNKANENLENGTKEPEKVDNRASSSTDVHVNGQNGKSDAETVAAVSSTTNINGNQAAAAEGSTSTSAAQNPVENSSQNDSVPTLSRHPTGSAAPTGSEPAISTSADITKDQLAPASLTDTGNASVSSTEPTSTSSSSNNVPASTTVPEATVAVESTKTPEPKSKVNGYDFKNAFTHLLFFAHISLLVEKPNLQQCQPRQHANRHVVENLLPHPHHKMMKNKQQLTTLNLQLRVNLILHQLQNVLNVKLQR